MSCSLGGFLAQWVQSVGGPAGFRERFGPVGPLVTVPIHVSVALTPFPSDVISVANGTLYGFWLGASLELARLVVGGTCGIRPRLPRT